MAVYRGGLCQAPLLHLQCPVVKPLLLRHTDQPAIGPIRPAVVGAREPAHVTPVKQAHLVATMTALVDEHPHLPATVTHHDHGHLTHVVGDAIPGPPHHVLMPDRHPAPLTTPGIPAPVALHLERDRRSD